jgi:hypothetical protein
MNTTPSRAVTAVTLLAALVALPACEKKIDLAEVLNQRPEVRLTNAPVESTSRYFYAYRLNWVGYDPDGRVEHFLYAIDPPTTLGSDTVWTATERSEEVIFFRASVPDSLGATQAADFHVFVIKAVDDRGLESPVVSRAFFSYTIAPTVELVAPRPSCLLDARVTPAVFITWTGRDEDGQFSQRPVKYKYKLLKEGNNEFPIQLAIQNPDSLRRFYAPGFVGWDSTSAETTFVRYTSLVPNSRYLFIVVGIDEAGAYSPVFSCNSNMVSLNVGFAGSLGPVLFIANEFFNYAYPSGGVPSEDTGVIRIEVPADVPLRFFWIAFPDVEGATVEAYRWCMDIEDLDDDTPRTNELTDLRHWSQWSLGNQLATLGTFTGLEPFGATHRFYVEARDINGLISRGTIEFRVVRPTFNKDLLIVDDTRLNVDQILSVQRPDTMRAPSGDWPTAAELDTFLYARGGVRWRMTPPGTTSPQGIFLGYSYDTLGTRNGLENPTLATSLSKLGEYRHIIWYVDFKSSEYTPGGVGGGPTHPITPMTTLRYMSSPGRQNTLATWVVQGGKLWALGGAFANATTGPWNNLTNDRFLRIYTSRGQRPDLVAGRFMFDLMRWQSEFIVSKAPVQFPRALRAVADRPGTPDYNLFLPPAMERKTPATDAIYPFRGSGSFYVSNFEYECMTQPMFMLEDENPDPDIEVPVSTLDTLFVVSHSSTDYPPFDPEITPLLNGYPVMTSYRGVNETEPSVIFSGFNIWHFKRQQCIDLVDFVLNRTWHLQRQAVQTQPGTPAAAHRARE